MVRLHERSAMRGVFTVENEESVVVSRGREKTLGQLLLVTKVHSTFDVSAIVLILETAVNDGLLVIQVVISTIKHLDEGLMSDARKALGLRRVEMRQLQGGVVLIHYGRHATWRIRITVLLCVHNVARTLKHAE